MGGYLCGNLLKVNGNKINSPNMCLKRINICSCKGWPKSDISLNLKLLQLGAYKRVVHAWDKKVEAEREKQNNRREKKGKRNSSSTQRKLEQSQVNSPFYKLFFFASQRPLDMFRVKFSINP